MQNTRLMFALITPPVSLRCVYAFALDDGTVKLGSTGNVDSRISKLQTAFRVKVVDAYATDYLPLNKAVEIERACLRAFACLKVQGEIFTLNFDRAKAELDKYADVIAEYNRTFLQNNMSTIRANYEKLGDILGGFTPAQIAPASEFETPTLIVYHDVPVLTTAQLASFYQCKMQQLQQNFNNNRDKFVEGEHYFKLEGTDLQAFKLYFDNFESQISPMTRILYLWTEAGVARHCKMINTPKAWEVFGKLEDAYFADKTPKPAAQIDDCLALIEELAASNVSNDTFRKIVVALLCRPHSNSEFK